MAAAAPARWRTIAAWTLSVLGCVLAPLAIVATWTRDQAWLLVLLAVLCLGGGIAVATDRRRAVFRAAVGVAIAMVVTGVALTVARRFYLDVRLSLRVLLAVALVSALVAWVAGPSSTAARLRAWGNGLGRGEKGGAVRARVGANKNLLRGLVGLAVAISLVAMDEPRLPALALVGALGGGALLLIEVVGRGPPGDQLQRPSPPRA